MTRARRTTAVVAGALLVVVVGLVAVLAARALDDDGATGGSGRGDASVVGAATDAGAPFDGLTAGTIAVGGEELVVVVADDDPERSMGLRGRRDASPYDGMLFAFDSDTTTAFTMAGVPGPLDIGFYAADGRLVDRLEMQPCAGTDSTCPVYQSSRPFRYALETGPGSLPTGRLRVGVTGGS